MGDASPFAEFHQAATPTSVQGGETTTGALVGASSSVSSKADLLRSVYDADGWSKTAMVELLGAYSNQDTLLTRLQSLLEIKPSRSPDQDKRPPKQIQNRLSPGQQTELLQRYLAGERAHLLAKAFEINRTTVAKLLTETGVRRPRSLTEPEITKAIQLYEEGWSCQRIGDRLGRDRGTIWLALKSAGVELRQPWSRP